MGRDSFNVQLLKALRGVPVLWSEKTIHQPGPARRQNTVQLIEIFLLALPCQVVKTADIQGQLEGSGDALQLCGVVNGKLGPNIGGLDLFPGELDCPRGKIHACHLPSAAGQRNDVRARAAANIDGAAW